MKEFYTCGCWEDEDTGIVEFCKYHDKMAAAEELNDVAEEMRALSSIQK